MASWPETLPVYVERDGYSEGGPDGALRSPVDAGLPKVRARWSAVPKHVKVSYLLTATQKGYLDTFWQTTTRCGSISFTWTDPSTGSSATARFLGRPTYTPQDIEWLASFSLEIIA